MPVTYVAGKNLVHTFTPTDGTAYTMGAVDVSGEDGGDKLDVTTTLAGGYQALLAGINRWTYTYKILLDASSNPFDATRLLRFGTKGVVVSENYVGAPDTVPCMITKVGRVKACAGRVEVDITFESDALTGAPTYGFVPPPPPP
jgi:hypothetical protein